MTRTDIINAFISKYNLKSYLEIGVQRGVNFNAIHCNDKTGVDPDPIASTMTEGKTLTLTSDAFFESNKKHFDIVFIDGLHHADQVEKDIINALAVLNKGGVIVCHDMSPKTKYAQEIPIHGGEWNGDCWKAWVKLRTERKDLEMFVVDTDYGCGVIRKGKQALLEEPVLEYEYLEEFREEYLNLISIEKFNAIA
jgi:hypothetical protein